MKSKTWGWLLLGGGLGMLGLFWWLSITTRPPVAPVPDVAVRAQESAGHGTLGDPLKAPAIRAPANLVTTQENDAIPREANAAPTVGDILAEPDENYVRVAKKLTAITLDPAAPMEEREEALAHALNLSAGNEAEVLMPLVNDPALPDALADTILAEALNRPLSYQADLYLVALAARKSPEMQTKIREHLTFLTGGEDKGPNPADWAAAVKAAKAEWPE